MTDREILLTCDGQGKKAKEDALERLILEERAACINIAEKFTLIDGYQLRKMARHIIISIKERGNK